jgi:L-cysteine desulfidase
MNQIDQALRDILKKDVQLAVGCTEPVAVGFLAKEMKPYMPTRLSNVHLRVSRNIYKNGKSVCIPGTEETGLVLACAIGLTRNNPGEGLLVFEGLLDEEIEKAKQIVNDGCITLSIAEDSPDIFVEIILESEKDKVVGRLAFGHNNLTYLEVNGKILRENLCEEKEVTDTLNHLNVSHIIEFVENFPEKELAFLNDGIAYNFQASEEGMEKKYGLGLGRNLQELLEKGVISKNSATETRILTAAAADMRMGGGLCPIMTSGGSGNQGIGIVIPIVTVAKYENIDEDKRNRALVFGHLMNELVKIHSGKLSGMCGCAIGSGVGATAGISWMLGGSEEEISSACNYMFANLTGMLCDGAKDTCSLKLSTCAYEAVLAGYLSKTLVIRKNIGVVGDSLDHTIKNIGYLAKEAFSLVDDKMMDIINPIE